MSPMRGTTEPGVPNVSFIDTHIAPGQPARAEVAASDAGALDAYSRVVTSVAEALAPSIVSLRVASPSSHREGTGSGVVITPDGFMLTSAHVVEGCDRGSAYFSDGAELPIDVVGCDPLSDIAVVRCSGAGLQPAPLGDAGQLRPGQLVVAIGNPLGFGGSLTAGVVSALGRSFATRSGRATRFVENVIQTDAALHPGNSGGALADGNGRVVGINTAVVGPGIGQGLGLAVPINDVTRGIIVSLMRDGRVRRCYLGIAGGPRPVPPRLVRVLDRDVAIEVVQVMDRSPAQHAGLRSEDLILEVAGEPVRGMDDVQRVMDQCAAGVAIPLRIYRDGSMMEVHVVPEELID